MRVKNIKIVVIVAFIGLLVLPNIVMVFSDTLKLKSNNPVEIAKQIKSEYANSYGLKKSFLNGYLTLKKGVLHDITLPNKSFEGKNNWWFLGNHYNETLYNVFGHTLYKESELIKVKSILEAWHKYLKSQNISFYVLVPPNKNKVYKEFLPYALNEKTTKVQQLNAYLKANSSINFTDLTQPLLNAKQTHATYIKTDTHWNDFGAFVGYKKMLEAINVTHHVKAEKLSDYSFKYKSDYAGDIPQLVKAEGVSTNIILEKENVKAKNTIYDLPNRQYVNSSKTGKVLVYHDSFMLAMMPFVNETFGEVNYRKMYQLNQKEILDLKPNMVVLELVERNLDALLKLKKPLN